MKKILLLTAMSLTCFSFNAEAMENIKEDLSQSSSTRATSTMGSKWAVNPDAPITTGFFDKTLMDTTMEKTTKLQKALMHVTHRKEKYELFLEQIGATYFRTKFLQDETLQALAMFMMSYFEEKLERLEKKHVHFQSYLEDVSELTKSRNPANPIGTYSGKHRGDLEAQANYAHEKIKVWEIIFSFVDQFPLTKASTSPIIQRAIEAEAQMRVEAFGNVMIIRPDDVLNVNIIKTNYYYVSSIADLETSAKNDINQIAQQKPVRKLNDIISNAYDLKSYAETRLKKWRTRIGEKQKINILGGLLKSLNINNNEPGEEHGKPLALGWKNVQTK